MMGYLKQRSLKIRYKNRVSKEGKLNSVTGQGCILGLWCFFPIEQRGATANERNLRESVDQADETKKTNEESEEEMGG